MSRKNFCMTTLSLYSITSSKHDRFFFLGMSVRIRRIIWCSNRLMICILDPRIHILYCPSSGCNGMECHFSMRLERSCRCLVVLNVPSVMVTGVVGLSHCMLVEGLDVHRTYCFSRYLGCNIQLQQVTGVPKDTGSMTPGSVSLSCPTLTFSCQWIATCMGVW